MTSLDFLFGSIGIYALIDTVFTIIQWSFVGTMEDILKLLIGAVTLVYFCMRAYHYFHMSAMDREKKRLEIDQFKRHNS